MARTKVKGRKARMAIDVGAYAREVMPRLAELTERNREVLERLAAAVTADVRAGRSVFVFGSGHSAIFALELFHRAGGASFVIPIVADYLLPSAGPSVVRVLERTAGSATPLLDRAAPAKGEMLWLCSQSGINGAGVDLAIEARKRGMRTVAFTSVAHSCAVRSRHSSGKRLFEVCDEVVDLGGVEGDALVPVSDNGLQAGPFSTLASVILGHSILVAACAALEAGGTRCVYSSVNTPEGESRNRELERRAAERDILLR